MQLTRDFMLERFFARDRAFDGRFLVGVVSTGIYCLPSCPARNPRPENVRFFTTEDECRAAGLRACRRCRPDVFRSESDPEVELIQLLGERLRERPGELGEVADLARAAGLGVTRLGELFRRHRHESVAGFAARTRIEVACEELLATDKRVLDVALDAGFESSSAFHANFKRHTGMSPRTYRALRDARTFRFDLPGDFRLDDTLAFLGRDPESPCERVEGRRFFKALVLAGRPRVLELALSDTSVEVTLHGAQLGDLAGHVHRLARGLLGLHLDPAPFERRAQRSPDTARLVRGRRGLRIPQTASVFEGLVWTIVGQQVNLAFAFACRRAVVELTGRRVGGMIAHPTSRALSRVDPDDLVRRKLSRPKARYLQGVAAEVAEKRLPAEHLPTGSAVDAERRLLATHGIGPWSANYVLMRSCGFADCTPVGDSALAAALQRYFDLDARPDGAETAQRMEAFAPYRSLATFHLWAGQVENA